MNGSRTPARCADCGRLMNGEGSCVATISVAGRVWPRIPRGDAREVISSVSAAAFTLRAMLRLLSGGRRPAWATPKRAIEEVEGVQARAVRVATSPCSDCGAAPATFHHAGCDEETCPACYGQLVGCSCSDEEEVE